MAGKKQNKPNVPKEIRNGKAKRDYFVEDIFEAGIILTGTEVKSLRAGESLFKRELLSIREIGSTYIRIPHRRVCLGIDEQSHPSS